MKAIIRLSIIAAIMLFMSTEAYSQKVKYAYNKKTQVVSKNGEDYLNIEKKGKGVGAFHMNVYDSNGVLIMVYTPNNFKDPSAISSANPEGYVRYSSYYFPTLEMTAEYTVPRAAPHKLAIDIDTNELIIDGGLNEAAVKNFVAINGMKFTEQKATIIRVISN